MRVGKKLLSLTLGVAMVFSSFSYSPKQEVKAASGDTVTKYDYGRTEGGNVIWDVYETSWYNFAKSNNVDLNIDNLYKETDESVNISTYSNGMDSGTTYYTSDGQIAIKGSYDAGSFKMEDMIYAGNFVNHLSITVPDVIIFHQAETNESGQTEEKKDKDGKVTSPSRRFVKVKMSLSKLTTTSVGRSFGSRWNNSGNCSFISVKIPNGVTVLGDSAFADNTKLRGVEFSNAIQSIGSSCFEGCNNLISLDLNNLLSSRVNTIPDKCFYRCNSLQIVSIPKSILNIGNEAFYQCDSLDYIYLGDDVQTIGSNAFANCSHLRYVYITSKYNGNNWKNVVADNELNKLVTEKVTSSPVIAGEGTTSSVGSEIFKGQKINIFSRLDVSSVSVTKDGVAVPCTEYLDTTFGYSTKAYTFNATDKGTYTVNAVDMLGNKVTKTFKYAVDKNDTTAPVISIEGTGSDDCYQSAKITVTEVGDNDTYISSVRLNDEVIDVPQDSTTFSFDVTEEDAYTLEVKDLFGNTATQEFTVDATEPIISGVENGKVTREDVNLKFSDDEDGCGLAYVKVNGEAQTNLAEYKATVSGSYKVEVADKAGNVTEVSFIKDSIGPSIVGVSDGKYYKHNITLKLNSIAGVNKIVVNYVSTSDDKKTYEAKVGQVLGSSGQYSVELTDNAGSTKSYGFYIDKTAPKVSGVSKNKCYRSEVRHIKITDMYIDKIKLNGQEVGDSCDVSDEGSYTLVAVDRAKNTTVVKFKVDRTAPKVSGISNKKKYKKSVKIKVSDKVSGVKSVKVDGKKVSLSKIKKGYKVSRKGSHKVVSYDKVGNKSTVKFTIK